MKLGGLMKLTLLDFPETVACTVFTRGCNFRCPFCHNASLVVPERMTEEDHLEEDEFFKFLSKRQGVLDGVCVSGGEPLMWPDARDFIARIKEMGFKVKLDTNGSYPDRLKEILDEGLLDYVAMDIKSAPESYGRACGLNETPIENVRRSIEILRNSGTPYEFRTTVVDELHGGSDEEVRMLFEGVGRLIEGKEQRYFLQEFEDSGMVIGEGYHAMAKDKMLVALEAVRKFVPMAALRGE